MTGGLAVVLAVGLGGALGVAGAEARRRRSWVAAVAVVALALGVGYALWTATGGPWPWMGAGTAAYLVATVLTERRRTTARRGLTHTDA